MDEWVLVDKQYPFEVQAKKAAQVIIVTESRLLSVKQGVSYDIETEIIKAPGGWQIRWRKVLVTNDSGCDHCSNCQNREEPPKQKNKMGTVLPFKPRPSGKRD